MKAAYNQTYGWDHLIQIQWAIGATFFLLLASPHLVVLGHKVSQNMGWATGLAAAAHFIVAMIGVAGCGYAINQAMCMSETDEIEPAMVRAPSNDVGFVTAGIVLLVSVMFIAS